jgi:hypothetical protein
MEQVMRCEEIQERFVDLLYSEQGTPAASPELTAHIQSCPACRMELEELKGVRSILKTWKDESPLKALVFPSTGRTKRRFSFPLSGLRYAALAAAIVLAFLALANAEITWNDSGFAFRTHLLGGSPQPKDYYTQSEVRDLLKRVVDDTEGRVMETNYLLIQQLLDTMEEERFRDLRLVRSQIGHRTQ